MLAVSFPLLDVKAPEPWLTPPLHLLPDIGVSRIANRTTDDRISLEVRISRSAKFEYWRSGKARIAKERGGEKRRRLIDEWING